MTQSPTQMRKTFSGAGRWLSAFSALGWLWITATLLIAWWRGEPPATFYALAGAFGCLAVCSRLVERAVGLKDEQ